MSNEVIGWMIRIVLYYILVSFYMMFIGYKDGKQKIPVFMYHWISAIFPSYKMGFGWGFCKDWGGPSASERIYTLETQLKEIAKERDELIQAYNSQVQIAKSFQDICRGVEPEISKLIQIIKQMKSWVDGDNEKMIWLINNIKLDDTSKRAERLACDMRYNRRVDEYHDWVDKHFAKEDR